MPVEKIQAFIKKLARDLLPSGRAAFLSNLDLIIGMEDSNPQVGDIDDTLIDEIQELASTVDSGELCDGYGWDPEIKDSRDFGDESWAQDVDNFLSRVRGAILSGQYHLAYDAYDAIFSILELGQEVGHLPGPPDPEELLETDMDETRSLYLRATYLASTKQERPSAIMDALLRFGYNIGAKFNLTRMRDAGKDELPSFGEFLADWIALLEQPDQETRQLYSWNEKKKFLLNEAKDLSQG